MEAMIARVGFHVNGMTPGLRPGQAANLPSHDAVRPALHDWPWFPVCDAPLILPFQRVKSESLCFINMDKM